MPWTLWSFLQLGFLFCFAGFVCLFVCFVMSEVTLYKRCQFLYQVGCLSPGPQSGHLYFLNRFGFLGKYGRSPAKDSALVAAAGNYIVEVGWIISC